MRNPDHASDRQDICHWMQIVESKREYGKIEDKTEWGFLGKGLVQLAEIT